MSWNISTDPVSATTITDIEDAVDGAIAAYLANTPGSSDEQQITECRDAMVQEGGRMLGQANALYVSAAGYATDSAVSFSVTAQPAVIQNMEAEAAQQRAEVQETQNADGSPKVEGAPPPGPVELAEPDSKPRTTAKRTSRRKATGKADTTDV